MNEKDLEIKEVGIKAVLEAVNFCINVQDTLINKTHVMKDDMTPATLADFGAQAIVCRILNKSFPDINIIAEERSLDLYKDKKSEIPSLLKSAINNSFDRNADILDICHWIDISNGKLGDTQWILDPLDGTRGFLRGQQYAIALALMANRKIEFGILGCPNLQYDKKRKGCIFVAKRGYGATQFWIRNHTVNKPIQVSSENEGSKLKIVESVEAEHTDHSFNKRLFDMLSINHRPIRLDSQAKYAMVARGEVSAYLRLHSSKFPNYRQKIWDHAAGSIIVEEAGGEVTDFMGRPLYFSSAETLKSNIGIVATNGLCHRLIIDGIRNLNYRNY